MKEEKVIGGVIGALRVAADADFATRILPAKSLEVSAWKELFSSHEGWDLLEVYTIKTVALNETDDALDECLPIGIVFHVGRKMQGAGPTSYSDHGLDVLCDTNDI